MRQILKYTAIVIGLALLLLMIFVTVNQKTNTPAQELSTIRITSPQNGSTIFAGETVAVVVEPNDGVALQRASAWVVSSSSSDIPPVVEVAPFLIQIKIPEDRLGPAQIMGVARDEVGNTLKAFVEVFIESRSSADSVDFQPQEVLLVQPGDFEQIYLSALFSDGISRDITQARGVSYSSSNQNVAVVSPDGRVTAVAPGMSTINIRYQTFSGSIPISVSVSELRGDLDGDGDVDQKDVDIILVTGNITSTGPDDPRDLDGDGKITSLDARRLMLLCSRSGCTIQ